MAFTTKTTKVTSLSDIPAPLTATLVLHKKPMEFTTTTVSDATSVSDLPAPTVHLPLHEHVSILESVVESLRESVNDIYSSLTSPNSNDTSHSVYFTPNTSRSPSPSPSDNKTPNTSPGSSGNKTPNTSPSPSDNKTPSTAPSSSDNETDSSHRTPASPTAPDLVEIVGVKMEYDTLEQNSFAKLSEFTRTQSADEIMCLVLRGITVPTVFPWKHVPQKPLPDNNETSLCLAIVRKYLNLDVDLRTNFKGLTAFEKAVDLVLDNSLDVKEMEKKIKSERGRIKARKQLLITSLKALDPNSTDPLVGVVIDKLKDCLGRTNALLKSMDSSWT